MPGTGESWYFFGSDYVYHCPANSIACCVSFTFFALDFLWNINAKIKINKTIIACRFQIQNEVKIGWCCWDLQTTWTQLEHIFTTSRWYLRVSLAINWQQLKGVFKLTRKSPDRCASHTCISLTTFITVLLVRLAHLLVSLVLLALLTKHVPREPST